jgi:hypothetical protein
MDARSLSPVLNRLEGGSVVTSAIIERAILRADELVLE